MSISETELTESNANSSLLSSEGLDAPVTTLLSYNQATSAGSVNSLLSPALCQRESIELHPEGHILT